MKLDRIKDIANAVLYEGYILYPYRPSSIKNRQRWTFGGVFPKDYAGRQGDDCTMQTQLLVRGAEQSALGVYVRFLQVARFRQAQRNGKSATLHNSYRCGTRIFASSAANA